MEFDDPAWFLGDIWGLMLTSGNPRLPQCSGDDSNVCLMDAGHWSSQGRKPCVERFLAHRKRVTSLKVSPDLREQLATGRRLGGRYGRMGLGNGGGWHDLSESLSE